jgi:hypothetical protein
MHFCTFFILQYTSYRSVRLLGADHIENTVSAILLHIGKCLLSRCLTMFFFKSVTILIQTWLKAGPWINDVRFLKEKRNISFLQRVRSNSVGGPSSVLSNGYRGLFPRGFLPMREVDHWPQSGCKVKNNCSYTCVLPCIFIIWRIISVTTQTTTFLWNKFLNRFTFS